MLLSFILNHSYPKPKTEVSYAETKFFNKLPLDLKNSTRKMIKNYINLLFIEEFGMVAKPLGKAIIYSMFHLH